MRNTDTNHSDKGLFAAMEQKLSRIDERLEEHVITNNFILLNG